MGSINKFVRFDSVDQVAEGLRVCPERLFPCEAPEHQSDHSDADEGNGGSEVLLVMAYEASAACEP